ncbi:MAG: bifunctional (p)ppGpp synthetase/guanosine-3',5'-bis(diphosphate) 3'-pyrophosphohydrolase [Rickettsia endosymbiont of Bryobia graminum]|nr:bifunctional (p)ppGpp synthetase/guanosine-3',5'-bis(diphosphate) 3'-pyrophosphohydrolase [Rickettsia endosymbiont of Bryobia graminum]
MKFYDIDTINITNRIHLNLLQNHIASKISCRLKDPWSTLKKMFRKKINIESLSDIIAVRVIVNSKEDYYNSLDIIDEVYYRSEILMNSDFIKNPKNNGYQSLHIVICNGFLERDVEVQIRTNQMHEVAEFGTAHHYIYKQEQEKTYTELFSSLSNQLSFNRAYNIFREFNWTESCIIAYELELKKLWQELINSTLMI